jgi:stage III sporulation protein SpoIIIAA
MNDPQIIIEINKLYLKLEELERCNLDIERKIDLILKNTERIDQHIDFVDRTYETIKKPFHYLMDKVSMFSFKKENND